MIKNRSQDLQQQSEPHPLTDLGWVPEELENLLYVVERAGMAATARDLRFAVRSAQVELRQREAPDRAGARISRDDGGAAP